MKKFLTGLVRRRSVSEWPPWLFRHCVWQEPYGHFLGTVHPEQPIGFELSFREPLVECGFLRKVLVQRLIRPNFHELVASEQRLDIVNHTLAPARINDLAQHSVVRETPRSPLQILSVDFDHC